MKKLFFTIFVVLFFSVLFIVEILVKAVMKLFGYSAGESRLDGSFENNKQGKTYSISALL